MSTTERNETVSSTQLAPINMTKDAANPDFGTMPEDYEGYNSRPLDDIPLTKYNSETDRGTLCKSLENYIETNPNQAANNLPQGSDIQKEAVQAINGGKDAEVRNDAVEDFINQMEKSQPSQREQDDSIRGLLRSNYAKELASNVAWNEAKEAGIRGRSSGRESQLQDEMINDDSFQPNLNDINRLAKAAHGLDKTPEENDELKQALGKSYDDVIEKIENSEDKADANLLASEWLKAQGFSTAKSQNKLINKIGKFLLKEGKFPEIYRGPLTSLSARDKNKLLKQGYMAEGKPANRKYGLKSLGLDAIADFENRLKKLKDKSNLENFIEQHPEVIKETVPEDNPIHKEAEQVTDGDARTTEANNEKIEEGIKQGGIDWDAIEAKWNAEHEAAANPSSEYKDEFGRDVPDFVSNDEPALDEAVNEALSEYFDNTDELYDYLMDNGYGDDVFDPGLEDQNQYSDSPINEDDLAKADETIYDESMASQPTISEKRLEPAPEAPNADNVVQIKEDEELDEAIDEAIDEATDGFKMPHFEIGGRADQLSAPHGSISPSGEVFMNKTPGSSFGRMFSNISPSNSAGAVNAASINGSGATKFTSATTAAHSGTGSPSVSTPNEAAAVTTGSKQGTENNGNLTANGVYNSGAVNHSGTSLKASNIKLPNGETRSGQNASVGLDGNAIDLKDAHIENLESRIRSIPTNLAEQLGFGTKYKHVTYNGLNISECGPREIQEIEKILSTLGV